MTPYMDRPFLAASNIKGPRLVHLVIKLPMVAPLAHYNCITLHITLHSTLVYYGLARLHVQSNSLHLHVYDIAGAAQYYQLSLKMHTMLLHICYWTGLSCTKCLTRAQTHWLTLLAYKPDYHSIFSRNSCCGWHLPSTELTNAKGTLLASAGGLCINGTHSLLRCPPGFLSQLSFCWGTL